MCSKEDFNPSTFLTSLLFHFFVNDIMCKTNFELTFFGYEFRQYEKYGYIYFYILTFSFSLLLLKLLLI